MSRDVWVDENAGAKERNWKSDTIERTVKPISAFRWMSSHRS